MAEYKIDHIKLPNGDINYIVPHYLKNLVDGSAEGSLRTIRSAEEQSDVEGGYALGTVAFAEGVGTQASGDFSHAEGSNTVSSGLGSHAEGLMTSAHGDYSHTSGFKTTASGRSQTVVGESNLDDGYVDPETGEVDPTKRGTYAFIVGNGYLTNPDDVTTKVPSNAFAVSWDGDISVSRDINLGGDLHLDSGSSMYIGDDTVSTTDEKVLTTAARADVTYNVLLGLGSQTEASTKSYATKVRVAENSEGPTNLSLGLTTDSHEGNIMLANYLADTGYTVIQPGGTARSSTTITLPSSDGILALKSDLGGYATLDSPAFTGVPTAPDPDSASSTNPDQVATVGYVLNHSGGGGGGSITGVGAGTGLSGGGTSGLVTLNHSNSITAQTTSGVYPIKIDAQGHISEYGAEVNIPTIEIVRW